jgi:hypothetical protein
MFIIISAGDFMAVNTNEFRELRGFVEPPQNMHADSLGLFKLVLQMPQKHCHTGIHE